MSKDTAVAASAKFGIQVKSTEGIEFGSAASFVPALRLYTMASKEVKGRKIAPDTYAIPKKDGFQDILGTQVDVWPIDWKYTALDTKPASGRIKPEHDPESAAYKALVKRSNEVNSGCIHGPEILVYIPSVDKFATFHLASKSAQNLWADIQPKLANEPIRLGSKFIEGSEFSWTAPTVEECDPSLAMPTTEQCVAAQAKFHAAEPEAPAADADTSAR